MKKINFFNKTNYDLKEFEKQIIYGLNYVEESNFTMNIIFVSSEEIQKINLTYRNNNSVTDVISFANCDIKEKILIPCNELGDIFICVDKAKEQSIAYGHTLIREIVFLSIHGYLHLNGYDHLNEMDEKIMFQKQKEILEKANIKRE